MNQDGSNIPNDVKKLIAQSVKSVGHLETLLFLFNNREQSFSALEISRELRTNEALARHQLRELSSIIGEQDADKFTYIGSPELDPVVAELVVISRERPHAVINYIYSNPPTRDSILNFADAFKLKKD